MSYSLHTLRRCAAAAGLALASLVAQAQANPELPGQGVKVLPLKSSIAEETFQTLLVMKALRPAGLLNHGNSLKRFIAVATRFDQHRRKGR